MHSNNPSSELICLNDLLLEHDKSISQSTSPAYILILRNFVVNHEVIHEEILQNNLDKKAWMRGRVVNKLARWNLCYADYSQIADYENKKGTIVDFKNVPLINDLRKKLSELCNIEIYTAELNHYYDLQKTGISWHGDSERKIVIGARFGNQMPLCFNWFYKTKPVGEKLHLSLNAGDIYMMSEKAVGTDWKKSSIYTLRHSAGCDKYTNFKISK